MKSSNAMLALLALGLGLVFVSPATADVLSDFQVNGRGVAGGTCQEAPLTPGCFSHSGGQVRGTFIDAGTYTLAVTGGSPPSVTGFGAGTCLPASGTGQIVVAATGDVLNFKTVGWICEEFIPGSPYHYDGTYRIDSPPPAGGTGQFATAAGGGSLTATFEKGTEAPTFLKLDGTIKF